MFGHGNYLIITNSYILNKIFQGNKLFSHGYYIRDLQENEFAQITKYREEIADFQKVHIPIFIFIFTSSSILNTLQKLNDAFSPTNFLTNSTSVPIMPIRPNLPSFCTGNDTTLYILGACTLQVNFEMFTRKINPQFRTTKSMCLANLHVN